MLVRELLLVLNTSSLAVAATSWIVPGAVWTDTNGQKIDAHGGGIVKQGNTFSWDPNDVHHNNLQINRINSKGSVGNRVNVLTAGVYEAPGMFYAGGTYFLVGNPNQMFYSDSISGSWHGPHPISPGSSNTYGSQNMFELVIKGTKKTTYIYMGDIWDSTGGPSSNYLWLPMSVDKLVYKNDHESDVVFENVTGTGEPEWVSFYYTVNDVTAGDAHIYVNDQPTPLNISELNSWAGYHQTALIQLTRKPSDTNTLRFAAMGTSDFEIFLDAIKLH
ncbi:hypothetical protein CFD26_105106 [Aspergillus turcosus]|uniref:CBM6 domain-containing protein n=1 Tax=Aspergillus turcosus TaxID=1245748 RepID=A0A3R7F4B6_9EURO|nr:hypothetical protein CFD26_105106 [Aspergillus turcosus]